jgi:hypothetical protein
MKFGRVLAVLFAFLAVIFSAQNLSAQEIWTKAQSKNFQLIGNA